jgi:phenylalanyl-tRNA synthetase alpha chain
MKNIDTKQLLDELKEKLLHDHLNATQIIEVKNVFVKKHITPIYDQLKLAPINEKKELGNFVNIFKNQVNELFDNILEQTKIEEENKQHAISYDVNINSTHLTKGGLTPLSLLLNEVMEYFKRLNFQIVMGSEIIETKYNFDHLNIGLNHPARSYQDSFFINKSLMLRTHCTAQTAMALENNKSNDIRVVTFGSVYRNDDDDATHSHQFNQIDLL